MNVIVIEELIRITLTTKASKERNVRKRLIDDTVYHVVFNSAEGKRK